LNTLSVIDQSSSVIPVSMAGSLLPDTHRFEEMVIREYPYPIFAAIRPHDLVAIPAFGGFNTRDRLWFCPRVTVA
jgi:hypothetical protein